MADKSLLFFKINLHTESPLRIGGKDDPMSSRESSVVSFGNIPIVPGPSLKGALRAKMESHLISKFYDPKNKKWKQGYEALRPCIPNPKLSSEEEKLVEDGRYRNACAYSGQKEDKICPVCYFLGAQGLIGFVNVPFLTANGAHAQGLYSLRIDRGTGTGPTERGRGGNRPYEVVRPGVDFNGTMSVLLHDPARGWKFGKPRCFFDDVKPDEWLEKGMGGVLAEMPAESQGDASLDALFDKEIWTVEEIKSAKCLISFLKELLESIDILGGYKSKGCGCVKITVK